MLFLIWDERGTGPVAQVGSGILYPLQHGGEGDESPVRCVTLKLFQAGLSFVLEAPLSLECHRVEERIALD